MADFETRRPYNLLEHEFVLEPHLDLNPLSQAGYLEGLSAEATARVFDAAAQLFDKLWHLCVTNILKSETMVAFMSGLDKYPAWRGNAAGALFAACLQTARLWETG